MHNGETTSPILVYVQHFNIKELPALSLVKIMTVSFSIEMLLQAPI